MLTLFMKKQTLIIDNLVIIDLAEILVVNKNMRRVQVNVDMTVQTGKQYIINNMYIQKIYSCIFVMYPILVLLQYETGTYV